MNTRTHFLLLIVFALIATTWYLSYRKSNSTRSASRTQALLRVGTNAEFPPYSYVERDEIVGFDIDLVKAIGQKLNRTVTFKSMSFDALIPDIQLGELHMLAAGITPTEERAKRVFFTKPYFTGDPLLILSPADKPLSSLDGLKNKRVAVNLGFTADLYLSDASKTHNIEVQRIPSSFVSEGILALQSNRADAFVVAQSSVQPYFASHPREPFSIIPLPQTEEQYALVVSKHYPELFEQVKKVLTELEEDGTIAELKTKWGLA